eukprot:Gb_17945 [translate_table: standard]
MEEGNNTRRLHHHHHHHQHHHNQQQQQQQEGGEAAASSNGLTLSLPLPPPPPPTSSSTKLNAAPAAEPPHPGGDRHGRDDIWSQGATVTLIEAWGDRYLELNRGNLKQKHWKEVADAVNSRGGADGLAKAPKTDVQCKNRLDTLKKKYKVEKSRIFNGGSTKWALFHKMDELIGPSRKQQHKQQQQQQNQHNQQNLEHQPLPVPPIRQKRPIESPPELVMPVFNYNNKATSKESPDMTESCLNGFNNIHNAVNGNVGKKRKVQDDGTSSCSSPFKELANAIIRFGEIYERIEGLKQRQMMDLEKQRMEVTKDLELQRMQLFVQTQLELAKIKHGKHGNTEHYL